MVQQSIVNGLLEFQSDWQRKKIQSIDAVKCSNMTLNGESTRAPRDWSGSSL